MTTSRLPYVIDGLVTLARAFSAHRDPRTRGTGIPVFDGADYGLIGDRGHLWTVIGWSGDPDAVEDAASVVQTLANSGNPARQRDERGQIRLRITAQRGDRDIMKTTRDLVFAELGLFEQAFRDDPTIGLSPSWMREIQLNNEFTLRAYYDQGPICQWTGSVEYRARI